MLHQSQPFEPHMLVHTGAWPDPISKHPAVLGTGHALTGSGEDTGACIYLSGHKRMLQASERLYVHMHDTIGLNPQPLNLSVGQLSLPGRERCRMAVSSRALCEPCERTLEYVPQPSVLSFGRKGPLSRGVPCRPLPCEAGIRPASPV